jgi:3-(3-hydroxy-phenyl)propionate hydroxylase
MSMLEDGETVGVVLAGRDPRAAGEPTLDELAAGLRTIYGTDFGVHAPTWLSRFSDATRQADAYRKGRILLAGDAAHIHPPLGGQGLNLGVQDAVNLGWKLAQDVKGVSPDALLDTYQAERHPPAARVLRNTIAQGVLRRPDDRTPVLGEFVAEMLAMDEPRRRFGAMIAGLDIAYAPGAGHPLVGRRMPDLDIATVDGPTRVYALLRDARPVRAALPRTAGVLLPPAGAWPHQIGDDCHRSCTRTAHARRCGAVPVHAARKRDGFGVRVRRRTRCAWRRAGQGGRRHRPTRRTRRAGRAPLPATGRRR